MTEILEDMDKVQVNTVAIVAFLRLVFVVAVAVVVMVMGHDSGNGAGSRACSGYSSISRWW